MTTERTGTGSQQRLAAASSLAGIDSSVLLDQLLTAVSHDLRTPLLAISLGLELLAEDESGSPLTEEQRATASRSVHTGVRDLERLIDGVSAVSRARRRPLADQPMPLGEGLEGQVLLTQEEGLRTLPVALDPIVPRELWEAVSPGRPAEIFAERTGGSVLLTTRPRREPDADPLPDASPVSMLLASLETHAGTLVEHLAVLEVLASRQGATLGIRDGSVTLRVPLA